MPSLSIALSHKNLDLCPKINEIQTDLLDWVSLMQRIARNMGQNKLQLFFDQMVNGYAESFVSTLWVSVPVQSVSQEMRVRLMPLLEKTKLFFESLVAENGSARRDVCLEHLIQLYRNIDLEVHRLMSENRLAISIQGSAILTFLKTTLKNDALNPVIDDFFAQRSMKGFFEVMMRTEAEFFSQRCLWKSYCTNAKLPSDVEDAVFLYIFPLFESQLQEIKGILDKIIEWFHSNPSSLNASTCMLMMLQQIESKDNLGDVQKVCDRFLQQDEPIKQQWIKMVVRLATLSSIKMSFDELVRVLDGFLVHKLSVDMLAAFLDETSSLSIPQLLAILEVDSSTSLTEQIQLFKPYSNGEPQTLSVDRLESMVSRLIEPHHEQMISASQSLRIKRDYVYLVALSEQYPLRYDKRVEVDVKAHYVIVSELEDERLSELAYDLSADLGARASLQLLAVLLQAYYRVTGYIFRADQLLLLLLVIDEPKLAYLCYADHAERSGIILALYCAFLAIRERRVYLEASIKGSFNQDDEVFFSNLGLTFSGVNERWIEIKMALSPDEYKPLKSSYVGPQSFSKLLDVKQCRDHAFRDYLEQAFVDSKLIVLNLFSAWNAIIVPYAPHDCLALLDVYRMSLLTALDDAWHTSGMQALVATTMIELDAAMDCFQTDHLQVIWGKVQDQLIQIASQHPLSKASEIRADFLKHQGCCILDELKFRSSIHSPTAVLNALDFKNLGYGSDPAVVKLWYDQNYLNTEDKQALVFEYLQNQLSILFDLCPNMKARDPNPNVQLRLIIDYLEALIKTDLSEATIKAIDACVALYQVANGNILGLQDCGLKISSLVHASEQYSVNKVAQTLVTRLAPVINKNSFYYQWLERSEVLCAAEQISMLAKKITESPDDKDVIKALYSALVVQYTILQQDSWYFPFAWLLGYPDTKEVLRDALQTFGTLHTIGHCTINEKQASKEAALHSRYMTTFTKNLSNINKDLCHIDAWTCVINQINQIQFQYDGYAMIYELRHYLLTQRHKFMLTQPFLFYNPGQVDRVDVLLQDLNHAIQHIQKQDPYVLCDPLYLAHKSRLLACNLGYDSQSVNLSSGAFGGCVYFDVCITSKSPLPTTLTGFHHLPHLKELVEKIDSLTHTLVVLQQQKQKRIKARQGEGGISRSRSFSFDIFKPKRMADPHVSALDERMSHIEHQIIDVRAMSDRVVSNKERWVKRLYGDDALFDFIRLSEQIARPNRSDLADSRREAGGVCIGGRF